MTPEQAALLDEAKHFADGPEAPSRYLARAVRADVHAQVVARAEAAERERNERWHPAKLEAYRAAMREEVTACLAAVDAAEARASLAEARLAAMEPAWNEMARWRDSFAVRLEELDDEDAHVGRAIEKARAALAAIKETP